jgi:DNA-binding beta-propeller fold protein YncE
LIATVLVGSAALAGGCSSDDRPDDDLMLTDNPVAATPAVSPPVAVTPAGTVLPLNGAPTAMVVDLKTRLLAVAVAAQVVLYQLDNLAAKPQSIPLSGFPTDLRLDEGGVLVAALDRQVVRISLPYGDVTSVPVDGEAVSTARLGGRTLVAARNRRQVLVLDGGTERSAISGEMFSADQVLATGDRAVLLDRVRNAVFELDVPGGAVKQGLRAGEGSTNAATDRYGRVLVTDTRGESLLAFSLDPLLLRQRYPVAGAPYGIAYDGARDLAWVTLTATNEVVGYQLGGEEPRERYRFPTVRQPNTVTVDSNSGRVIVASADAGGIQVISV